MTAKSAENRGQKRKSVSDGGEPEIQLSEAVEYFSSCSARPKLRGNIRLQLALERVEQVAMETGLPGDDIVTLVDVIGEGLFPESVNTRLVKHLIPAVVVPSEAVVKAISWMCTNKPSSNMQTLLIRWIVLIYETIDKLDDLHALYGVIFYFLQNDVMCKNVCQLLHMLTRKEDMRLFRVRMLLRLQKKMGAQPYLQGLLSLYQIYAPQYIVLRRTNQVFFRQTDRVWSSRVRAVLDRRRPERPLTSINNTITIQPYKRTRKELIPGITTSCLLNSSPGGSTIRDQTLVVKQSVPFAQITSFELLLQNLDRLELPSQMAAALRDRNLQHVLLCHPDPTIAKRLAFWLDNVLYQEFLENMSPDKSRGEDLLQTLVSFSEFLKESVPVCENFLVQYLHIWNGSDYRPLVLQLIPRFRLYPYQYFSDVILEPLRKLFFCSSVYFKCQLLKVLTQLLHNLVTVELPRYRYCYQRQQNKTTLSTSTVEDCNTHCVFEETVTEFCPEDTMLQFIEYVGHLADVGLQLEKNNPLFMHCVLTFYELVCGLHAQHKQAYIVLPHKAVIYHALFAADAPTLSRMCHMICRYRDSFLSLRTMNTSTLSEAEIHYKSLSVQKIRLLNQYILDYCDSLWRHRAFSSQEQGTIYGLVSEKQLKLMKAEFPTQVFSLHRHPALIGFVKRFMDKNFEDQNLHRPSTIRQCRDEYLSFLEMDNLPGISEFIAKNISRRSSAS